MVVRGKRGREPRPRVVADLPPLAGIVLSEFAVAHAAAGGLEAFLRYNEPDQFELMVAVLEALNRGCKDATAARALGLSLRTYRRRVAEVLSWLDVSSRFAAGVRAAELGLIRAR
jgi:hypothetical protein